MNSLKLWYDTPAIDWETQALPIGNGRLGAMVFGGVAQDTIQFNEETLFSGKPTPVDETAYLKLSKIRELLKAGKPDEAQICTETEFLKKASYGDQSDFGAYQNFGELHMTYEQAHATAYRRELDIANAIASVRYQCNEKQYQREYFSSCPDDVIAIRVSCDHRNALSLSFSISPGQKDACVSLEADEIVLSGSVQFLEYEARVKVLNVGGTLESHNNELHVHDSDEVVLLLTAATDYQQIYPAYKGHDFRAHNRAVLDRAATQTWQVLKTRHITDYQSLFHRVSFHLDGHANDADTTDRRMARMRHGTEDAGLVELLFQYGRYLLISSSRPGTLPANLQGIWNNSNDPQWGSMFCYNINLNMNYWPAEATNLHECHQPMVAFIRNLQCSGRRSAKAYFGANGWFTSKKSDVWGFTQPYADAVNGLFLGGAGWLCQDIWEYYCFSGDFAYLKQTAYPIMKECAEFYLDYLQENDEGVLVASPATSPENYFFFQGKSLSITDGCEMDHRIIDQLFEHCIRCCDLLKTDESFKTLLRETRRKLAPVKIGAGGGIQEWYQDYEYCEKHHRHLSPLYGIYPGNQITPEKTPELVSAGKMLLNERGDGETGWSRAWKINLWARLLDGNRALTVLYGLLKECIHDNLFDTCPPFQIDGNLGYTAGIAEMLMQSDCEGNIALLPALPDAWVKGAVTGLKARGNVTVDIIWEDGRLLTAKLRGMPSQMITVNYDGSRKSVMLDGCGSIELQGGNL